MKILLADDEPQLTKGLRLVLEKNGYAVDVVDNGLDALNLALTKTYDAFVLDIMMPGLDGLGVLSQLRQHNIQTSVILLTAMAELNDCIAGLDAGADDYLTKPFRIGELLARLRSLSRRQETITSGQYEVGDVVLSKAENRLIRGDQSFYLSRKEFLLMEMLTSHLNSKFRFDEIIERVWDQKMIDGRQVVRTYVAYLNNKLAALGADLKIKPVASDSYVLEYIQ